MLKKNRAIFWDRDGVLNKVIIRNGKISSPRKMEEFKFLPNVKTCLKISKEMGFLNIVFTSQPDIRRGLLKIEDLKKMHKIIEKMLLVDEIKFCPHDDSDNCFCRKPKPGLIIDAAKKWSIDLGKSYVIGDTWKDMGAGKAAGCKTLLIRKKYNEDLKENYDFEVNSLKEAVETVKNLNKK